MNCKLHFGQNLNISIVLPGVVKHILMDLQNHYDIYIDNTIVFKFFILHNISTPFPF